MYHPRLQGDYYQMGFRYGSLLSKFGFELPKTEREKVGFGVKCLTEIQKVYPEIVEEIEGFCAGAKCSVEELAGFLLSIGAFEHQAQCSLFAKRNKKGEIIIGRNFDSLFKFQKYTESVLVRPDGKLAFIGQSEVFIGKEDGINQAGLFIGMAYVNGKEAQPGFNFLVTVRYILEHFTNVSDAIHFLKSVPIATYNNFLIADRETMAVVESCPHKIAVRKPHGNFINCTNFFVEECIKKYELPGIEWSRSAERFCAVEDSLTKETDIDLFQAKQLLSDRNSGVCLNLKNFGFGTLWSVVANLNKMHIERAEGMPSISRYKVDGRLNTLINKK